MIENDIIPVKGTNVIYLYWCAYISTLNSRHHRPPETGATCSNDVSGSLVTWSTAQLSHALMPCYICFQFTNGMTFMECHPTPYLERSLHGQCPTIIFYTYCEVSTLIHGFFFHFITLFTSVNRKGFNFLPITWKTYPLSHPSCKTQLNTF